jgi:hypothetical protein
VSPVFRPGKTVTLTRKAVVNILVHNMGWDEDDAARFWNLALRETRDPGCLERALRQQTECLQQAMTEG